MLLSCTFRVKFVGDGQVSENRKIHFGYLIWLNKLHKTFSKCRISYFNEPSPEYAPKKNSTNRPPAARPPTVATIQRGILPISLITIIKIKF